MPFYCDDHDLPMITLVDDSRRLLDEHPAQVGKTARPSRDQRRTGADRDQG